PRKSAFGKFNSPKPGGPLRKNNAKRNTRKLNALPLNRPARPPKNNANGNWQNKNRRGKCSSPKPGGPLRKNNASESWPNKNESGKGNWPKPNALPPNRSENPPKLNNGSK